VARQEEWEAERKENRPEISPEEVAFIVSRWTGIPVTKLRQTETDRLVNMEDGAAPAGCRPG
jgi:ATP-dependent Clp protease ATP-binding subunit ClpC